MSRGVASATATELATKNFNIISLLEFQIVSGSHVFLTDAPVDITYNSNSYLSY